jgi:asparagine synthase (glutamine-hydrolysing)
MLSLSGYEAAAALMDRDANEYLLKGRERDMNACSAWIPPRFPFGDEEVRSLARRIPLSFKISGGTRKTVLRRAAVFLGVPESIAYAPKKAAQYSSGTQKMLYRQERGATFG